MLPKSARQSNRTAADATDQRERALARRVRVGRFLLVAQMVARIYGGYKFIQWSGRLVSFTDQPEGHNAETVGHN